MQILHNVFLTYYSVGCQTKSLSNLCVRFAMFPVFLAIYLYIQECIIGMCRKESANQTLHYDGPISWINTHQEMY